MRGSTGNKARSVPLEMPMDSGIHLSNRCDCPSHSVDTPQRPARQAQSSPAEWYPSAMRRPTGHGGTGLRIAPGDAHPFALPGRVLKNSRRPRSRVLRAEDEERGGSWPGWPLTTNDNVFGRNPRLPFGLRRRRPSASLTLLTDVQHRCRRVASHPRRRRSQRDLREFSTTLHTAAPGAANGSVRETPRVPWVVASPGSCISCSRGLSSPNRFV